MTFADIVNASKRYRYERIRRGRPSSHNSDTCAYCRFFYEQDEEARRSRRSRREEIEAAFEEGGLGRSTYMETDNEEDDEMAIDDEDESASESEEEGSEWEMTVERGACHGVVDVAFTGLTEKHHGDAWCHYMYYGRLREWDGLVVLVGVPVSVY